MRMHGNDGRFQRTHGHSFSKNKKGAGTPTYTSWMAMIGRCRTRSRKDFADYGAVGITVCDRWKSFENFLEDMGERPGRGHQIDRINNARGYEPGNCRWATAKENSRNKTNNHILTYNGLSLCIAEWGDRTGISRKVIHLRIQSGWSTERALTTPVRKPTSSAPAQPSSAL